MPKNHPADEPRPGEPIPVPTEPTVPPTATHLTERITEVERTVELRPETDARD